MFSGDLGSPHDTEFPGTYDGKVFDSESFDANVDAADLEGRLFSLLFQSGTDSFESDGLVQKSENCRQKRSSADLADNYADSNPRARKSSVSSCASVGNCLSPGLLDDTNALSLSSPTLVDGMPDSMSALPMKRRKQKKKVFKEKTIVVSSKSTKKESPKKPRRRHSRGNYMCRLCGLPKKNHKCKFAPLVKTRKKKRKKILVTVACQASFDDDMTVAHLNLASSPSTEAPSTTTVEPSPRPLTFGLVSDMFAV